VELRRPKPSAQIQEISRLARRQRPPIFLTRDRDATTEPRICQTCAHRGALSYAGCRAANSTTHVGNQVEPRSRGQPDRRAVSATGIEGRVRYDAGFERTEHGLQKLRVASYGGRIFVSFSPPRPNLSSSTLGAEMCCGRIATLNRSCRVPCVSLGSDQWQWKLYDENVRDPYHGPQFVASVQRRFGIARVSQEARRHNGESGRHNVIHARKPPRR